MNNLESISSRDYEFNMDRYLSRGWEIFRSYALPFVGFTLLVTILSIIVSVVLPPPLGAGRDGSGFNLVANILSPILGAGQTIVALQIARNRPRAFSDFFGGFNHFLPILLLSLVNGILVFLGLLLLVLPGI